MIVQAGQTSACYDADFYPFGGEIAYVNSCPQNYKFEGHERDAETGYDNFGARFYNSSSAPAAGVPFGRFTSADWSAVPAPVPYANLTNLRFQESGGLHRSPNTGPQTLNLYAIVSDNPETFADLDGHQWGGCQRINGKITLTACEGNEDPNQQSEYWNTSMQLAAAASAVQDPSGIAPPANCPDCSGAPAQQQSQKVSPDEVPSRFVIESSKTEKEANYSIYYYKLENSKGKALTAKGYSAEEHISGKPPSSIHEKTSEGKFFPVVGGEMIDRVGLTGPPGTAVVVYQTFTVK